MNESAATSRSQSQAQSQSQGTPRFGLRELLQWVVDRGGSDLHVTTGTAPGVRIDGALMLLNTPPLTPEETQHICYEAMSQAQRTQFEHALDLDFSFGVKDLSRFRANVFMQRGAVAGVFRAIPTKARALKDLGMPAAVNALTRLPQGLVLVTGPTGSGKSTTLASMIDRINEERNSHIMTVEDPIEFLHQSKQCVVNQREVGVDTKSFTTALKHVLRQDPDVVLVGEMRDLETIEAALTISETGHLVFATLHTNSAVQSINRILDVFPADQQAQIRAQLSFVLRAVVTQMLLPRADGPGRALAAEVLIPNIAIRNLIRESKVHQIYGLMQTGQGQSGMQTMNQSLFDLCKRGLVAPEVAIGRSPESKELSMMLQKTGNMRGKQP